MKLLIGVTSVPTTLLTSPPTTNWACQCSSASLQVLGGTSFGFTLVGNSFNVSFGFGVGFEVDYGFVS